MLLAPFGYTWLLVYGKKGYDVALFGYSYASKLNLVILTGLLNPIFHTAKYFRPIPSLAGA